MGASEFLVKLNRISSIDELNKFFEEFLLSCKQESFSQTEVDIMMLKCTLFKFRGEQLRPSCKKWEGD